ncbi:hypothetical protein BDF19DRAFT_158485 [Syncephalis fuscata]|nr:hypothetical protein BDF19DRAFT_158485 [Syncephalis fuscata]
MNNMANTRRKRMQVKCACEPCHQACKKCDDARPCTRCVRYGCEASCVDHTRKARQPGVKRGPYRRTPELAGSSGNNSDTNTGTGISNRGASSNDNNNSTIRSINTNNRNINNMAAFSIVAPTPGSSQARLHAMPRMVNDSISSIASSSVSSDEDMDARSHSSMSLSYSSSLSPSPVLNGYQRTATYVQNLQGNLITIYIIFVFIALFPIIETKRHFNSNILHTPPLTMADFTSTPSPVHLTAPKAYPAQPLTLDVLAGIASRITNNILATPNCLK